MSNRDPNILRHPGLRPLWEAVRREWRIEQFVAVGLLLLGTGLFVFGLVYWNILVISIGGLLQLLALWWLFRLSRRQPVSELFHILLEEPEQVGWVYALKIERLPFGLKFSDNVSIYFLLKSGNEIIVSLPEPKLKLVMKTLNRVLPSTEFGYTEERELKYRGRVTRHRSPYDPFNRQ